MYIITLQLIVERCGLKGLKAKLFWVKSSVFSDY